MVEYSIDAASNSPTRKARLESIFVWPDDRSINSQPFFVFPTMGRISVAMGRMLVPTTAGKWAGMFASDDVQTEAHKLVQAD